MTTLLETTTKNSMAAKRKYGDHDNIVGDNNKEIHGCMLMSKAVILNIIGLKLVKLDCIVILLDLDTIKKAGNEMPVKNGDI